MAPNIRHRFGDAAVASDVDDSSADDGATQPTDGSISRMVKSVSELKGSEVVIDGTIYDLSSFHHPGGGSIMLFGGTDVSVQYKMIHPYHTRHHLEKMKATGKLDGWKEEYAFDTPFEREIKREVFKIVRRGREFGTPGYFVRAAFYLTLMLYCQYQWSVHGASWSMAVLFGVAQALIGLNVQHDANHGAASKKPWINDLLGFGADIIGGDKWTWQEQHWTHHAFTNHAERDPDSFNAEPMMAFNDYPLDHPNRRSWHRFQAIFFLPLLSFYWLSMVFNPEILDLMHRGSLYVGIKWENDFIVKRRKYAIAIRLTYIFLNILRPFIVVGGFNFTTFLQILAMGAIESLTLASLFALSHNFENVERNPTKLYKDNGEPVCWFKSQVETSSTYGGWVAGALTGGLNFQVRSMELNV